MEALNLGANRYLQKGGNPRTQYGVLADAITQEIEHQRSEEKFLESEQLYRAIVEEAHDSIIIYRGDRILFANDRVCEKTGYSKEELYNMNAWNVFHPDDRKKTEHLARLERIKELDRKRAKGERIPPYEARILTKDGRTKHCEFAVTTITHKGEHAVLAAVRDITERKEAEEEARREKERFEELFEGANEMIITTDREGYVYRANATSSRPFPVKMMKGISLSLSSLKISRSSRPFIPGI